MSDEPARVRGTKGLKHPIVIVKPLRMRKVTPGCDATES